MRKHFVIFSVHMGVAMLAGGSMCWAAEATKTSQATLWTLDKEQTGKLPAGATVFAGNWEIRAESDAPVRPMHFVKLDTLIIRRSP